MRRLLAAVDSRLGRAGVPWVIAVIVALAAVQLHRNGHTLGDDFTLYLRQAQSIFEGNPDQVVADNRFTVLNSPDGISPIAYPWGWPLLLSPFVQWWGLDFALLKLVEVGLLCLALLLLFGIVRRRTNRWVATAVIVVIGSSPIYLGHTDQLLSEYPHLAATLVVMWWIDRMLRIAPDPRRPWLTASTRDLVVVGVLAAVAFNMRRESIVLFAVVGAAQAVDVVRVLRERWRQPDATDGHGGFNLGDVRRLAIPHGAFLAAIVGFQLLLPSMLIPDNGGGTRYIPERIGDSFAVFAHHLGLDTGALADRTTFGTVSAIGVTMAVLALVGGALACWRHPSRNVPVVALMVTTILAVSTHFRLVDRYYLQVTLWVLFFAAYALYALVDIAAGGIGSALSSRRDEARETDETGRHRATVSRAVATLVVCLPLAALAVSHVPDVRDRADAARVYNDEGRVQWGPAHKDFAPVFTAVEMYTPPDSTIAFHRARTLTLYTDRRAIQPGTLETIAARADFYAMQKDSTYSQPLITDDEAQAAGLTKIWEDERWVIWRFPQ